jgi:hypothetical protein
MLPPPSFTCTTSKYVLNKFLIVLCRGFTQTGTFLNIPVTIKRSPGFDTSTSSSYTLSDTVCGVCPSGIAPGVSCSRMTCLRIRIGCIRETLCLQTHRRHGGTERSISTCTVCEQVRQRKKATFMSGITGVARMTRPLMQTSLSVSMS